MKALGMAVLLMGISAVSVAHDPTQHKNMPSMGKGDKELITFFVAHHKDGVEMLSRCEQVAQHQELKDQCAKSRADQEKESAQMKDWYKSWFNADAPEAMVMKPEMKAKMDKLKTLEGADFEKLFLPTMAQHHSQAIAKSEQCARNSQKDEMKSMCTDMRQSRPRNVPNCSPGLSSGMEATRARPRTRNTKCPRC